jgi:hypothetical protein
MANLKILDITTGNSTAGLHPNSCKSHLNLDQNAFLKATPNFNIHESSSRIESSQEFFEGQPKKYVIKIPEELIREFDEGDHSDTTSRISH